MVRTELNLTEYARLPDQYDDHGMRLVEELIEGELVVSPAASHLHAEIVRRLVEALAPIRKWGWIAVQEAGVLIPADTQASKKASVPQPDVMIVSREDWHRGVASENGLPWGSFTPIMVIEVKSPRNTMPSLIASAQRFFSIGTESFWIIDPIAKTVDVYRREGQFHTAKETVQTTGLGVEFEIDLKSLFSVFEDVKLAVETRAVPV